MGHSKFSCWNSCSYCCPNLGQWPNLSWMCLVDDLLTALCCLSLQWSLIRFVRLGLSNVFKKNPFYLPIFSNFEIFFLESHRESTEYSLDQFLNSLATLLHINISPYLTDWSLNVILLFCSSCRSSFVRYYIVVKIVTRPWRTYREFPVTKFHRTNSLLTNRLLDRWGHSYSIDPATYDLLLHSIIRRSILLNASMSSGLRT